MLPPSRSGVRRGELTYLHVASTVHGGRYDSLDTSRSATSRFVDRNLTRFSLPHVDPAVPFGRLVGGVEDPE